jgi:hypothetical protein
VRYQDRNDKKEKKEKAAYEAEMLRKSNVQNVI